MSFVCCCPRWSRDEATAYMAQHLPVSPERQVLEIDRYIVWPAQVGTGLYASNQVFELSLSQEIFVFPHVYVIAMIKGQLNYETSHICRAIFIFAYKTLTCILMLCHQ